MWNPILGRYECDHCGHDVSGEICYELTPIGSKIYSLLCGECYPKFTKLKDRTATLPGTPHVQERFTTHG